VSFSDAVLLSGVFQLRVWRRGALILAQHDPNMIVALAKDALAQLVAGDGAQQHVTQIAFGTDGTAPTPDDVSLTDTFAKAIDGFAYPAPGQVAFNWTLGTAEANGLAIREFGLLTVDDTLFARKSRAVIEKDDDLSLEGTWTLIF